MSIDQNLNLSTTVADHASAIENEIPAYRAISPGAIGALICGILSILCFASWNFLVFPIIGVVLGFLSERKIQRFPDILTGRRFAQAGIGLSLIFGLTSVSIASVQGLLRSREARVFAVTYEDVLRKGTFEQAVWYAQSPSFRNQTTPEKIVEEMTKSPQGRFSFEQKFSGVSSLKKVVDEPGAEVHFQGIEAHGEEDLVLYATAIYEIHSPQAKNPNDKERLALAVFKGAKNKEGVLEWWVDDVKFPYARSTFALPAAPVGDSHGHSH
ncbi:MAG: hypothetical protein NVSMB9_03940 [Isosphaeraceae bacterium]